ncbi:hypothetical protein SAMN05216331_11643 [Porphyromonadaceae bacterium KH3R12]|nr:hypothetical protein SAMN05216331_11643 [Porphyromonadaceae bacterium KH3R12]
MRKLDHISRKWWFFVVLVASQSLLMPYASKNFQPDAISSNYLHYTSKFTSDGIRQLQYLFPSFIPFNLSPAGYTEKQDETYFQYICRSQLYPFYFYPKYSCDRTIWTKHSDRELNIPNINVVTYRITALIGVIIGLYNMVSFLNPHTVFLGILHIPLLTISLYCSILSYKIGENTNNKTVTVTDHT